MATSVYCIKWKLCQNVDTNLVEALFCRLHIRFRIALAMTWNARHALHWLTVSATAIAC